MENSLSNIKIENKFSAESALNAAINHSSKVTFSTSFGKEDQIITEMIAKHNLEINIFTLDTGRLFEETYAVFNSTIKKYNLSIQTFYPDQTKIEKLISDKGPYSFYDSIENRKECCGIRKVIPLKRALKNYEVWITGLRAAQSENRNTLRQVEWDENNKIIKIHPLLFWTDLDVDSYINEHNIPVNALHKKGFPSIGCSSCTRAVLADETDPRAGRWWWENTKKECGLH